MTELDREMELADRAEAREDAQERRRNQRLLQQQQQGGKPLLKVWSNEESRLPFKTYLATGCAFPSKAALHR